MEDHGFGTSTDNALKRNKNINDMAFVIGAFLTVACIVSLAVISGVQEKKTQRVNKQVEAFEKTLPAEYLEYKQAVEHYRDSLMHTNGR